MLLYLFRLCLWLLSCVPKSRYADGVALDVINYFVQTVQYNAPILFWLVSQQRFRRTKIILTTTLSCQLLF